MISSSVHRISKQIRNIGVYIRICLQLEVTFFMRRSKYNPETGFQLSSLKTILIFHHLTSPWWEQIDIGVSTKSSLIYTIPSTIAFLRNSSVILYNKTWIFTSKKKKIFHISLTWAIKCFSYSEYKNLRNCSCVKMRMRKMRVKIHDSCVNFS